MNPGTVPKPTIGVLTQWFSPEPAYIPKTICDSLLDSGYTVRVLTGFPNYPDGNLYPGYDNQTSCEEKVDGVCVKRVPSFLSHDKSAIRRMHSFVSFGLSSILHREYFRDVDVIYVYATPMTAAMAAFACRLFMKIPFILHIQDLWPESVVDSGLIPEGWKSVILRGLIGFVLRPLYRFAQHIVVISPGMKVALVKRGVKDAKISVIYNWDGTEPGPGYYGNEYTRDLSEGQVSDGSAATQFVYAGNIGQMQDIESIVKAVALVDEQISIQVRLYGSGVAVGDISQLISATGVSSVKLMGRITQQEMKHVYESSDFQLITLKDRDVFGMTIPSKFQAAMSRGKPVVTTVKGDLAHICMTHNVGLVAEAENPASIAKALCRAASMGAAERAEMSKNAHRLYFDSMSSKSGIAQIIALLASAAKSPENGLS